MTSQFSLPEEIKRNICFCLAGYIVIVIIAMCQWPNYMGGGSLLPEDFDITFFCACIASFIMAAFIFIAFLNSYELYNTPNWTHKAFLLYFELVLIFWPRLFHFSDTRRLLKVAFCLYILAFLITLFYCFILLRIRGPFHYINVINAMKRIVGALCSFVIVFCNSSFLRVLLILGISFGSIDLVISTVSDIMGYVYDLLPPYSPATYPITIPVQFVYSLIPVLPLVFLWYWCYRCIPAYLSSTPGGPGNATSTPTQPAPTAPAQAAPTAPAQPTPTAPAQVTNAPAPASFMPAPYTPTTPGNTSPGNPSTPDNNTGNNSNI